MERKMCKLWTYFTIVLVCLGVACESGASSVGSNNLQVQKLDSLFELMKHAPKNLTYSGVFTFQHKDNPSLQSFRIEQWHSDNQVRYERLSLLNGPVAQILRETAAMCSDSNKVGHPSSLMQMSRLSRLYTLDIKGEERIAGREATSILAVPKDQDRYSTLFSVDNETGLILKTWLVDANARPLERLQFVDLTITPVADFSGTSPSGTLRHIASKDACEKTVELTERPWQIGWHPEGFVLHHRKQLEDDIVMFMYSDGLASYSVFIEKIDELPLEGVAQRGATLAAIDGFVHNNSSYQVAVVGEIPFQSAQRIAASVSIPLSVGSE